MKRGIRCDPVCRRLKRKAICPSCLPVGKNPLCWRVWRQPVFLSPRTLFGVRPILRRISRRFLQPSAEAVYAAIAAGDLMPPELDRLQEHFPGMRRSCMTYCFILFLMAVCLKVRKKTYYTPQALQKARDLWYRSFVGNRFRLVKRGMPCKYHGNTRCHCSLILKTTKR